MAIIGNNHGDDNDNISNGHYGPHRNYRTGSQFRPGNRFESGNENNLVRKPTGNNQNREMSEEERANANNAKNIRNLADAATTSGSPHAAAAGAAVKAADALTGGKASEKLGEAATKVGQRLPGGKKLQDLSNRAAESGISDAAGAATRLKTGTAPKNNTKPQSPNTGSDALKANKSRRHGKLWSMVRSIGGDNSQTEDSNTGEATGEEVSASEEYFSPAFRKVMIKVAVSIFLIILIVMFPLTVAVAVFGGNAAGTIPMVIPLTYNTDKYQPISEEGTEDRDYEEKYYARLDEYAKNSNIKTNYIHATLLYKNMTFPVEDENGEYKIHYKIYFEKAEEIYNIMKDIKNISYDLYGNFYNKLKDSSFFKEYYKDAIAAKGENGATVILDEIFELAARIDTITLEDDTVITDETTVTVKKDGDNESGDSDKTDTDTKSMPVNDYISDSIYATTDDIEDSEMVKAYTVAYSTNIVSKNKKLTIDSNKASMDNVTCSVKLGCSYDITGKLVDGPGIQSSKNTIFYKGHYYYKRPLTEEELAKLNKDINSVMGNVITNKNGTYPSLDVSAITKTDGDYKSILAKGYGSELNYKNIGEGSYDAGVEYGTGGEVFINIKDAGYFYEQKDYSNARFCGLKGYTIGGSGCGVTSMAMVASFYEKDKKYDPIYMNAEATKRNMCGGGNTGTKQAFFRSMATAFKYGYVGLNKGDKVTPNTVISNLLKGHLIIARMGKGTFTGGGHYIVLAGIRPSTRQVYVYDPNNRNNSKYKGSGNGWYSFNDIILKEANNFYIIYKQEG